MTLATLKGKWLALLEWALDPINTLGLLLVALGEMQSMTDWLVSSLGPVWSGHVLALAGIAIKVARFIQTRPVTSPDTHDDGTAGESQ